MGQGWAVYKAFKSLRKGLSPSSRVAPKALLAPGISAITRTQVVTLPPYLVPTHGDEGEPVRSGPSAARTVSERDRLMIHRIEMAPGRPVACAFVCALASTMLTIASGPQALAQTPPAPAAPKATPKAAPKAA